jgi:hypothetical protein
MRASSPVPDPSLSPTVRDDRLLAPTRWISIVIVPVLLAAFVILYVFPGQTRELWGWMICTEMSALTMGAGYMSGAYFFARVARAGEWHRVSVGFLAVTIFSTLLMITTVMHWGLFNHDHVSFWAWLVLYASTPLLIPVLWSKNQRTDPGTIAPGDAMPRSLRVAVAVGGTAQLAFAAVMFAWPAVAAKVWPTELETATSRSLSAFVAFPAVTWLWFLFDQRWSSFRITQQTATIGLALIGVAAIRDADEFLGGWQTPAYVASLVLALALNVALYVALDLRARRAASNPPSVQEDEEEAAEGQEQKQVGRVAVAAAVPVLVD